MALLSAKWSFSPVRITSLARLLAEGRVGELRALRVNRVIPIPQHWRQRVVRHFNPAALIGAEIARQLQVPCDLHVLRRIRATRPQKRVPVSHRATNQQDSFVVRNARLIAGERVLIVDDVVTSGATCSEAAAMLRRAGASRCDVAAIARVLDHTA